MATRYGADTGGTFTDLVADDGRVAKVLSTPDDPSRALRQGLEELAGDDRPDSLAHGTTVATNALLERLDLTGLPDVPEEVEAVAVCLLHADLNPDHERAVAEALDERGLDVTCS